MRGEVIDIDRSRSRASKQEYGLKFRLRFFWQVFFRSPVVFNCGAVAFFFSHVSGRLMMSGEDDDDR
jgi:hypothetical protein